MNSRQVLTNGFIWGCSQCEPSSLYDLFISDGKIENISGAGKIDRSGFAPIDLAGSVLMPAASTLKYILECPASLKKKLLTRSLRRLGTVEFAPPLILPNTVPVIDSLESLSLGQSQLLGPADKYGISVLFSAAITKGQLGRECVDFASLYEGGAIAFTDDGKGVEDDRLMAAAFKASTELGCLILQHAEYPGHGCSLASGPIQRQLGLPAYPEIQETKMSLAICACLLSIPARAITFCTFLRPKLFA